MEFIKNNTSELESTLILKVVEEDYKERVEKELKKIGKTAQIKGFRPGFVPKQMIEKLYGKDVIAHEVSKFVDEKLNEYIKNENIQILGEVLSSETEKTEFDVEKSKNFQFAFDFAVFPEISIDATTLKVPYYKINLTEAKLEEEIKNIQNKNGHFVEGETTDIESKINVKLVELNTDKTPKKDGLVVENNDLLVKYTENPAREEILKAKKGDTLVINLKEAIKNEVELASLLNTDKTKSAELGDYFELTVNTISNYVAAELNQELFDKLFGEGKVTNVEEAKDEIRKIYEKQYETEAKDRFRVDLKKVLESNVVMNLPEDFILRWQAQRQEKTTDELRKHIEEYKEAIKWDRILTVLAKQNNLEVEYNDMVEASKEKIVAMLYQYGMDPAMIPEESLNKFAVDELNKMDEHDKNMLIFDVIEKKVAFGLLDTVQKEVKEITFEQLLDLYKEEQKNLAGNAETIEENSEVSEEEKPKKITTTKKKKATDEETKSEE